MIFSWRMPAAKRFQKVYVEIGNVCNLSCGFCPEPAREKSLMSRALFERVIAQVAPLAERVCFHLWGEPLAHPDFAAFVDVCAAHAVPVELTTNGVLLDAVRADALLRPAVAQVNFSVHSFAANFPDGDIGPYLEKIFAFTRRALDVRPDLYVNYRLWNLEEPDSSRNDGVFARVERAFGVALNRNVDVRRSKARRVRGRVSLHFDSRFDWPSLDAPVRAERGTCRALSRQLGVLSDGTVVPCCLDKEGKLPLGDARLQPLEEVLAGERARRMAEGFRRGRLVEELCRRCTFVARFDGKIPSRAQPSARTS